MKNQKRQRLLFNINQFIFNVYYKFIRLIKNTQDCENCKYFGGLMCDHVDENFKCLGWEKEEWHPIKNLKYKIKIKRLVKKLRTDPDIKYFLK